MCRHVTARTVITYEIALDSYCPFSSIARAIAMKSRGRGSIPAAAVITYFPGNLTLLPEVHFRKAYAGGNFADRDMQCGAPKRDTAIKFGRTCIYSQLCPSW